LPSLLLTKRILRSCLALFSLAAADLNAELLKSSLIKSDLVSFWQATNAIIVIDTNAVISLGLTIIKDNF
jgi:hypothetical protein